MLHYAAKQRSRASSFSCNFPTALKGNHLFSEDPCLETDLHLAPLRSWCS